MASETTYTNEKLILSHSTVSISIMLGNFQRGGESLDAPPPLSINLWYPSNLVILSPSFCALHFLTLFSICSLFLVGSSKNEESSSDIDTQTEGAKPSGMLT